MAPDRLGSLTARAIAASGCSYPLPLMPTCTFWAKSAATLGVLGVRVAGFDGPRLSTPFWLSVSVVVTPMCQLPLLVAAELMKAAKLVASAACSSAIEHESSMTRRMSTSALPWTKVSCCKPMGSAVARRATPSE